MPFFSGCGPYVSLRYDMTRTASDHAPTSGAWAHLQGLPCVEPHFFRALSSGTGRAICQETMLRRQSTVTVFPGRLFLAVISLLGDLLSSLVLLSVSLLLC